MGRIANWTGIALYKRVKELYKSKLYNQMQLSHMYKIGQDQISRIVNERRWA